MRAWKQPRLGKWRQRLNLVCATYNYKRTYNLDEDTSAGLYDPGNQNGEL